MKFNNDELISVGEDMLIKIWDLSGPLNGNKDKPVSF